MRMLLTTRQVAQKLGVEMNVVGTLVRKGQLKSENPSPEGKRVEHLFDPKVVREFASTYTPPQKRQPKAVKPNGHAPEPVVDVPLSVNTSPNALIWQRLDRIENYLTSTRVELGTRLGVVEERLAKLMASWGVE